MTNTALDPRLGLAELTGPDAVGMQPAIAGHPIKLVAVALANPLRQAGVGAGEDSDGR